MLGGVILYAAHSQGLRLPGMPQEMFSPRSAPVVASFSFCHTGGGTNCVVDGDTFYLDGQKIRIADIDAPETHDFGCASELERGQSATRRLQDLLNSGEIRMASIDRDTDIYGRKLRIVEVNGTGVGEALVGEGLARWYGGGRRSWC
jgi:micrococcal nuclease